MKRSIWLQVLLVLAAVFIVFGQTVTFDFTRWDDETLIVTNPYVNPPSLEKALAAWTAPHAHLYIPLTYNVWSILAAAGQTPTADSAGVSINPYLFHAANVLLHGGSAILVMLLIRLLLQRPWMAAAGAVLFAIHPFQVEPVAWATGMKDVLSGSLAILALFAYMAAAKHHASRKADRRIVALYTSAAICLLAGSFAKPGIVGVPLMAMALDYLILKRKLKAVLLCAMPLIFAVLPSVIVTQLAQPAGEMGFAPAWSRPLIAGHALSVYVQRLVWPDRFGIDQGYPPARVMQMTWVYFAWLVPAIVTIAVLMFARLRRPLLAGWLVFIAGVAPVLGLTPFIFQFFSTVADRYAYLSMVGAAMAAAYLLSLASRRTAIVVCLLVLPALAIRSHLQAATWATPRSLFEQALRANPNSFVAHNSLAAELMDEAIDGTASLSAQELEALRRRAEDHLHASLRIWPDYYLALKNLAAMQMARGETDASLRSMQRAIDAYEPYPEPLKSPFMDHLALARLAVQLDRPQIATDSLRKYLKRHPGSSEAAALLRQLTSAPAATNAVQ